MKDCVFCKIAQRIEEAYIVHESTYTLAILDIFPASHGHILVIPKQHYKTFDEITDEEVLKELICSKQLICKKLVGKNLCRDYTLIQNNGQYAEQDIEHVHFHIIPRYQNDLISIDLHNNAKRATGSELQNILNALK